MLRELTLSYQILYNKQGISGSKNSINPKVTQDMAFDKKEQSQTAGDNATQTQIEHVDSYNDITINQFIIHHPEDATGIVAEDGQIIPKFEEENTSLWKRTLGVDNEKIKPLRDSYLRARNNAKILLDKIGQDFPDLTVHDISHVVSLWNVADTIIGNDYPVNPLEGYILGIAFLIHDAALSYYAVGGKEKLRDTIQWKDAYADGPGDKDEEEFKKECDFAAIRVRHAVEAESILFHQFIEEGIPFYIIEDEELRDSYGEIIGKIAASHHWSIDKVELKLKKQINPKCGMPVEWLINAQKLACILRCADTGHIDDGRAPDRIYRSLEVNGVSRNHWESQNHLCQVCEDADDPSKLCITSNNPFEKKDYAAWNVAYDAIQLFDDELKKSNHLLKANNIKEFPHNGVSGASSKEELSKYIETEDWQPCDFGVHASNVKALIENLGSSKLYGENHRLMIALRELIQNARDAICARKGIQESFNRGKITIHYDNDNGNRYIEVKDNGIGMSMDCIKNYFLNFGSSYWKSTLLKEENPGLISSGFKSIGKFGIGFYSVFMVAKSVDVYTRRYDKADYDAKRIEFAEGLTLSPILSNCISEYDVSTKIVIQLQDDIDPTLCLYFSVNEGLSYPLEILPSSNTYFTSLSKMISVIAAGLDEDVYFDDGNHCSCVHEGIAYPEYNKKQWLESIFPYAPKSIDVLANGLEFIIDENERIRGLIGIPDEETIERGFPSIETVNGLISTDQDAFPLKAFMGYVDFKEYEISRNRTHKDGPLANALNEWAIKKYNRDYEQIVNSSKLASFYYQFLDYCGVNRDSLIEGNISILYDTYLSKGIEIGTINSLKRIHLYLFSGIDQLAGTFRVHNVSIGIDENKKVYPPNVETLDDALLALEKMPEGNYDEVIAKFIKMIIVHPFIDGNFRVGQIWVNLMLKRQMNQMIDWRKVDRTEFYKLLLSNDDDLCEVMSSYLRDFLSSTYEEEIISSFSDVQ